MLHIETKELEVWDSRNEIFITIPAMSLTMEHSLISLSKWESKWHKPFLIEGNKTKDEWLDYYKCMILQPKDVDPNVFMFLSVENQKKISDYIRDTMTATTFGKEKTEGKGRTKFTREKATAELIYYWMFSYGIPMECEKWHLNRLMTLIEVFSVKNAPPKKQSTKDILASNAKLNAERKKQMRTRG